MGSLEGYLDTLEELMHASKEKSKWAFAESMGWFLVSLISIIVALEFKWFVFHGLAVAVFISIIVFSFSVAFMVNSFEKATHFRSLYKASKLAIEIVKKTQDERIAGFLVSILYPRVHEVMIYDKENNY